MSNLVIFSALVLSSFLFSTGHSQTLDLNLNPIRLLSDDLQQNAVVFSCQSWRWAVETHTLRDWTVIPPECIGYVRNYMVFSANPLYKKDLATLVVSIAEYLATLEKTDKDVVIFDLSDTLLSNLPYYTRNDVNFGAVPFNRTKFREWVNEGVAGPVPYMNLLYKTLLKADYKVVIITGSSESYREVLEKNLVDAGFEDWFKFFLKNVKLKTKAFKEKVRTELVEEGYNIVANIGNQWRDITGMNKGKRTFKVPNPMYYLG